MQTQKYLDLTIQNGSMSSSFYVGRTDTGNNRWDIAKSKTQKRKLCVLARAVDSDTFICYSNHSRRKRAKNYLHSEHLKFPMIFAIISVPSSCSLISGWTNMCGSKLFQVFAVYLQTEHLNLKWKYLWLLIAWSVTHWYA